MLNVYINLQRTDIFTIITSSYNAIFSFIDVNFVSLRSIL